VSLNENDPDQARGLVTPLISHPAAGPRARRVLAAVEEKTGNRTAAVEQYRKILGSTPDDVVAMNNFAYALTEYTNSPDAALRIAQRAKELAPNDAAVDDTLGWVLYRKGLYGSAVQQFENAVEYTRMRSSTHI
jgi:Tfp pilus assembly protein PilF